MTTVTLQPSGDEARRRLPVTKTPATRCGHKHGLQGMLGFCQLLTPEDSLAPAWIPVWFGSESELWGPEICLRKTPPVAAGGSLCSIKNGF